MHTQAHLHSTYEGHYSKYPAATEKSENGEHNIVVRFAIDDLHNIGSSWLTHNLCNIRGRYTIHIYIYIMYIHICWLSETKSGHMNFSHVCSALTMCFIHRAGKLVRFRQGYIYFILRMIYEFFRLGKQHDDVWSRLKNYMITTPLKILCHISSLC